MVGLHLVLLMAHLDKDLDLMGHHQVLMVPLLTEQWVTHLRVHLLLELLGVLHLVQEAHHLGAHHSLAADHQPVTFKN